ncbi:hypothetical protein [Micromonospora sp. NPDC050200]|uniref:hypothetical protein n=1 Tax=Micromonospora sp. NPDC050200 TaxID=3155664 RepID=UPI003403A950
MADRELSRKPKEIRKRLRRGDNLERDLAMLEEAGHKPVSEWDDEELAKGRPRDRRGSFSGRAPEWRKEQVEAEALRRHKEATLSAPKPRPEVLSKVLVELATNPETPVEVLTLLDSALATVKQRLGTGQRTPPTPAGVPPRLKDPGLPPNAVNDEDRMPRYLRDAQADGDVS